MLKQYTEHGVYEGLAFINKETIEAHLCLASLSKKNPID
jgi:hypothetical protein